MDKSSSQVRGPGTRTAARARSKPRRPSLASNPRRQVKIQRALYEIADAASAVTDMQSFYARLHRILAGLMYAKNFFIALHDEKSGTITWPYRVDSVDVAPLPPVRLSEERSATAWIVRHGQPLADLDGSVARAMQRGELEQIGTPSDGMGIPLISDGRTVGAIIVQCYTQKHKYTLEDFAVLRFAAQHISTALLRHRLIEETRQRNSELQVINSILEGLAAKLDFQAIVDVVGEQLRRVFGTDTIGIWLSDPATGHTTFSYMVSQGQRVQLPPQPPRGFSGHVLKTGKTMAINRNLMAEAQKYDAAVLFEGPLPKSGVYVPIMARGAAIGVVVTWNFDHEDAYDETAVRLLEIVAGHMGTALENARLFGETQRLLGETAQRNSELAIINSVQAALAERLDIHGIFDAVGEKLREIFDYQDVSIYSADLSTRQMTIVYSFEKGRKSDPQTVPMNSLYEHIVGANRTFIFNGDFEPFAARFGDYRIPSGELPRSALIVPVRRNKENDPAVYLTLQDVDGQKVFSASDARLLETLASSLSIALENARLWEQERMYRRALQRELDIGREIQAGFLPESLPQAEGWDIAAALMPAREVAGDFYDAFELPDGNFGLVIADVCDKGVGAALFMTLFRSLIRITTQEAFALRLGAQAAERPVADGLQRALNLTNDYIAGTHGKSGMFATLFFGILDPRDGRLAYINGGHEPPLVVTSGRVRESLAATGPAVGALLDAGFNVGSTQLQQGDLLFAFTDGVPDCQDPRGEFFGSQRLVDFLGTGAASTHALIDDLQGRLRAYIGAGTQFDDITLMAVRRNDGHPPGAQTEG